MADTYLRLTGGRKVSITKPEILRGIKEYNLKRRTNDEDAGRRYALSYGGRFYPPKLLLSLAIGESVNSFSGGEAKHAANSVLRELGFDVVSLNAAYIPRSGHDLGKISAPIPTVKSLIAHLFKQRWTTLRNKIATLEDGQYPGVYVLAYSEKNLDRKAVSSADIYYVGFTHAGIYQRVGQFIDGIEDGGHHSGAKRFFNSVANRVPFSRLGTRKRFYVAAVTIPCIVAKSQRSATDLMKMGEVVRLEYYVIAHIKANTGREPELNHK